VTAKRSRKPLAGYPKRFQFESSQDVDDYLSGDRVTCLLCGRSFLSLHKHLGVHETTEAEYKSRFNIPWKRGLQSSTTRARLKRAGLKAAERPERARHLKAMALGSAAGRVAGEIKVRASRDFSVNERRQRLLKIHDKSKFFDKAAFLNVMEGDKTAKEAAKELGYSFQTVMQRQRTDPAFREMVARTIERQSFRTQAKAWALGDRFDKELRKLFDQGFTDREAAKLLNVSLVTCNSRTKHWRATNAHNARVDGTQPEHLTIDGAKPPVKDAN